MKRAGPLALIFFGLLAYCNAISHPFVHDDVVFILQNHAINDLQHWYDAFKIPGAADGINTYYRPVLEVIYRLEYHFFGPHPYGFHLFNVVIHIINGLLLFRLLLALGFERLLAWVIALLFLVHPVQTEAVSCISGISNLWMALGVLLGLNAYLGQWYRASILCFVMAFLSKEQGLLFIPLVMVIDCYRGRKNYRYWFLLGFTACALMVLRQAVTGTSLLRDIMLSPGELYLRLAAIPRDLGMYLRLIFFPFDLHYYRSTDILQPNGVAWVLLLIAVLGIGYVIKCLPQTRALLVLGFGWFLAALLPVLNITPLINEYSFILTSEHFLYLPIVGILIMTVVAVNHWFKRLSKTVLIVVAAGCLLLTWYQNTFWRNEIALFERMLQFEPDFGRGHLLLAKAYYFDGAFPQAAGHYQKAYIIMSSYAKKAAKSPAEKVYASYLKEILFDWAQNQGAMGRWGEALDKLKQEAAIGSTDAAMYNNMAFVYLHLGDKKNAYLSLQEALHVDPSFAQARDNLTRLQSSP